MFSNLVWSVLKKILLILLEFIEENTFCVIPSIPGIIIKYYNKEKTNSASKEIAKEMKASVDECKKKMNALQSAFRCEKKVGEQGQISVKRLNIVK